MATPPYIVGIAGGSASGKTSFLQDLRSALPEHSISVICQDNYYLPKELQMCDEQGAVNFDLPDSINREAFARDLRRLISGHSIELQEYGFNNNSHESRMIQINPAPIIVMEGLFVFYYEEIRNLLDLKVYLDVREEVKLKRRIIRDALERGYNEDTVRYQWQNHVMPSYYKFLRPYRDSADIIVTNNTTYFPGLEVLTNHFHQILSKVKTPFTAMANS